jgi:PHD/YefM family antitoxin component YafN of YafNO toxin-antitoxin module
MAEVIGTTTGVLTFDALEEQTQQLVELVSETKCPVVIAREGKAAAVLVEAGEYEQLLRKLALMERIVAGERDIAEGRVHTQAKVEALLEEWLKDGE